MNIITLAIGEITCESFLCMYENLNIAFKS